MIQEMKLVQLSLGSYTVARLLTMLAVCFFVVSLLFFFPALKETADFGLVEVRKGFSHVSQHVNTAGTSIK